MLALASLAPSIGNRRMWRFIVLTDENLRRMLAHMVERRIDELAAWPEFSNNAQRMLNIKGYALHFAEAPATIIVINQGYQTPFDAALITHGMKVREVENLYARPDLQSIGGMIGHLLLIAESRGYATCWTTEALLARKDLHASLGIRTGEELVALITLGKAADNPPAKARKPIDELIEWR
jgi:nitroreductase